MRGNLGWSQEIEGEISVKRLLSPHERTYVFFVPEWCHGRPVPKLFSQMQQALEAIQKVEAWGPGCWEKAAKLARVEWYPHAIYLWAAYYEKILYARLPEFNIWYPGPNFAASLAAEIDELEQQTFRELYELRKKRQACVAKFKAVVEAANAATRGQSGSQSRLRDALRDAGLYYSRSSLPS